MKTGTKLKNIAIVFGAFLWLFASQIGILEQLSPSLHASVHSHFDATGAAHTHIPGHEHGEHDHHHGHHSHENHSHSDSEPDNHAHNPFVFTPISYAFSFDYSPQDLSEVSNHPVSALELTFNSLRQFALCFTGLHPPPDDFYDLRSDSAKTFPINSNAPPALV